MPDVDVRFTQCDGRWIAYAVFGAGPADLLFQQVWCPIDLMWDLPELASFLETMGRMARVIVFDSLGNGASDPIADRAAATFEMFADASRAVLDAVRASRVVLFESTSGGTAITFAATYPQRVQSLIVSNLRASFPEVRNMTTDQRKNLADALHSVRSLELQNPRVAHDPVLRQWWGRARRLLETHEQNVAEVEFAAHADVESVLPTVRVPTLVLHRRDNRMFDIETSRAAAARLPNARFVELPGSENEIFLGDTTPVFGAIEEFLAEPEVETTHDRPLATVLFTDIVSSTQELTARGDDAWRHMLDEHDTTMSHIVADYRGRIVKQLGDGILATFDGPGPRRALRRRAPRRGARPRHHPTSWLAHRRDRTPRH